MTDTWEDLGYVHAPKPKPRPPTAALELVRFDGERWEATVRRTTGKRCWVYANSEREVRALAMKEVNR